MKITPKVGLLLQEILTGAVGGDLYRLYRNLQTDTASKKIRLNQRINRLEKAGIITLLKNEYQLTPKGRAIITKLQTQNIVINKTKWDGTWRLVSYDIPDDKKVLRNSLRRQLLKWGFRLVQRSLWVLPWECHHELHTFCSAYGLSPFVIYMKTNQLPMEERLKKHFEL